MAEYPTVQVAVSDGVVAGKTEGRLRASSATLHVFPSRRTGRAMLVIRNQAATSGTRIDAEISLDDQARRRLIELLGGTAQ